MNNENWIALKGNPLVGISVNSPCKRISDWNPFIISKYDTAEFMFENGTKLTLAREEVLEGKI